MVKSKNDSGNNQLVDLVRRINEDPALLDVFTDTGIDGVKAALEKSREGGPKRR